MVNHTVRVTVLVPAFNGGRFITSTIASALRQTLADFELLVLDDGSTDDTAARVAAIGDSRIRLLSFPHRGAPAALNEGVAQARGGYLALLDHDDLWRPEKLDRHVHAFEANPGAAVTFSWSALIDEHERGISVRPGHWRGPIGFRQLLEDYVIGPSSSLVFRRSAIERAGGFDARLPRCHDLDLVLRIASTAPSSVIAVPETLTLYRRHAGQMSRDWRAMHGEWDTVIARCREYAPADTAAVEARARANMTRYFAYLAYETGEFDAARRFVRDVVRSDPGSFVTDPRNWKIAAACGAQAVLPAALHRALERLAGVRAD